MLLGRHSLASIVEFCNQTRHCHCHDRVYSSLLATAACQVRLRTARADTLAKFTVIDVRRVTTQCCMHVCLYVTSIAEICTGTPNTVVDLTFFERVDSFTSLRTLLSPSVGWYRRQAAVDTSGLHWSG
jgi:hypothetical protein